MKLKTILLITFISTFVFAIGAGDEIELLNFVNARHSAKFTKDSNNIKGVLLKGTKAKVVEVKKFSSGNSGLLVNVKDGKMKDQKVWVYYNPKSPNLKLFNEKQEPVVAAADAKDVVTTQDVPVIRDPASSTPLPMADSLPGQIIQANQDIAKLNGSANDGGCPTCAAADVSAVVQTGETRTLLAGVEASVDADGNMNARVKCNHKESLNIAWPGKMEVVIENNKVTHLDAQIDGCRITLAEFKQIEFPNKNIVLRNAQGCAVVFNNNQRMRKTDYAILSFGIVPDEKCVSFCQKVEKKFWQVEMNPQTKVCD